jgi:Fe-S oxidoreductase
MKVLLLNPPGSKLYVRNYYCGSTSKAGYLFQPLDLLMLSGRLAGEFEIAVIDAIADRLSINETIGKIERFKVDAVVCIVSMVSWDTDLQFLSQFKKQNPSIKIIANGDVFFEDTEKVFSENACIDAVIFDFISDDIIHYLNGKGEIASNMIYKKDGQIIVRRGALPVSGTVFNMPIPRHELFLNRNYRFPFAKHYPFTTVLTNFGCPFKCTFCIANALGFRYRLAEEVYEELLYISKLGIREVFFEDMTFGLPKQNAVRLLGLMISGKLDIGWTCFSRVDVVDREMLTLMKMAGCHTIMFGVESASEDILKKYQKGCTKAQITETFSISRDVGIKTVATFILGLLEDDRASISETIRFAKEIDCDYASFNIAVPRPGTLLREIAIGDGVVRKDSIVFDHSGRSVSTLSKHLSKEELKRLRKRAILEFYLRPSYILRHIAGIKTLAELMEHIREFVRLIVNIM